MQIALTQLSGRANVMERLTRLYEAANIDYEGMYLKLYIAYNAWYKEATGFTNDRQAIKALKARFVLWDEYRQGSAMSALRGYLERLAEYTQRKPFASAVTQWNGEIESYLDWRSVIEFWYQVRCSVVHGTYVDAEYVWFAYKSLHIFMEEIIQRMQKVASQTHTASSLWHVDMQRLGN